MERNNLIKKGVVFAVIVLFIGMSVSSSGSSIKELMSDNYTASSLNLDGTTYYVDDDFNESTPGWNVTHFAKIQDALNMASDGDTVFVYNGIYYGGAEVTHTINLIGENKENTILDGNGIGIEADYVNVSGFTVQNRHWSGIHIEKSDYCTISNCIIQSIDQFGIYIKDCNGITISNNYITDNFYGIGLSNYGKNNNILNNTFTANYEGLQLGDEGYSTVSGNLFYSNWGNGICLYTPYNKITNNIITASEHGLYCIVSNHNIIRENEISNHTILGVAFFQCFNNKIELNNFIGNNQNAFFLYEKLIFEPIDQGNIWKKNFWDKPRILPKLIPGVIFLFLFNVPIPAVPLPNIQIDWNPAQEPYEI